MNFDDSATNGTEWIGEDGIILKERKGGFIKFDIIKDDEFLTLLPEYYLRPYEPHFISEKELIAELDNINKEMRDLINEISGNV